MKIYIAGKITGLDYEEAESLFMHAETAIEKAGHTPLNPLKLVEQTSGCICGHELDPKKFGSFGIDGGCTSECKKARDVERPYGVMLAEALTILLTQAEGVYFLDNAWDSKGARIERFIADELGIPSYFHIVDLPIGSDWPEANAEAA